MRVERIGDATLYLADCRDVLPGLGRVDAVVTDPPYEAVAQDKFGAIARNGHYTRHIVLNFDAIDDIRDNVAWAIKDVCCGWAVLFCMAEGVRAWRDAIEATGAKYKRALVWIKPDAMPQFNGQGPSIGHEMMVAAWYGEGPSSWNGGGRPGTFVHVKNTPGGSDHPTQKPLPLIQELVELFSFGGDLVCDPFMGSGTTGVACAKLGRRFIGVELDPTYFSIACRRIEKAYAQPDLFIAAPAPKAEQLTFLEAAE